LHLSLKTKKNGLGVIYRFNSNKAVLEKPKAGIRELPSESYRELLEGIFE